MEVQATDRHQDIVSLRWHLRQEPRWAHQEHQCRQKREGIQHQPGCLRGGAVRRGQGGEGDPEAGMVVQLGTSHTVTVCTVEPGNLLKKQTSSYY